jgi:putative PIN family toxin of toxin-antitoxin system
MRKIVLDTNALLICYSKRSAFHAAWQAFLDKRYILCVSNEILTEYEEVLTRKVSLAFADMMIRVLLDSSNVILVNPTYRFNLITIDPDDNKFVDCAIVSNAAYIVSQDAHFNILKQIDFPKVNVIGIEEFIKELNDDPVWR